MLPERELLAGGCTRIAGLDEAGRGPLARLRIGAVGESDIEALLADFRRDPHNTPSVKDCTARVGADVLAVLVDQGALVQVSPEVLFLAETYAALASGYGAGAGTTFAPALP